MPPPSLGQNGETAAADYLQARGYQMLAQNWRVPGIGEVDIIAQDGAEVVFVEVKTRRGPAAEARALESITPQKQAKLLQLAELYCAQHDMTDPNLRFDVVLVLYQGNAPTIQHYQAAIGF